MKRLFSVLFFIILVNVTPSAYATIELISGYLDLGESDRINLSTGSVGTFTNTSINSGATSELQIDSAGFVISASAQNYYNANALTESASGALLFKVLEDSTFQFDWYAEGDYSGASLGLIENNVFIFRCVASGGCVSSSFHQDSGEFFLSKGDYSLNYLAGETESGPGGITSNGALSFSLQTTAVPLPAALWMFVTGLTVLVTRKLDVA